MTTQILVVEDENVVAMDLQNQLQRLGYAVPAIVSSGEEAIRKVEEIHPDLVLMDIRLKGEMDGIEAAEKIKARFKVPVIFLTAYADAATLQRAKATGPFGYILKPFGERELSATVEVALYRHEMEQRVRESEEKYRRVVENANEAIVVIQDGMLKFFNPKTLEITGRSQVELASRPFAEFVHLDDREMVIERYHSELQGDRFPAPFSFRIIDKTNDIRWVEARAVTINWEDKLAMLAFLNDITERKQAENIARRRMDNLRAMAEATVQLSLERNVDDLCRRAVELGREKLDIDRIGIWLAVEHDPTVVLGTFGTNEDGETRDERDARLHVSEGSLMGQILAGESNVEIREESLRDEKGHIRGTGWHITVPLERQDGGVLGVLSADSLLTKRVWDEYIAEILRLYALSIGHLLEGIWMQEALRKSEKKYRQLVEYAPAGIYEIDLLNAQFISVNDVMCEYTEYTKEEFLSLHPLDILTEESKERFLEREAKILAREPVPETIEYKIKGKNSIEFWGMLHSRIEYHDETPRATVIVHNIAERKRAEEEILRLQHLLQNITDSMPSALMTLDPVGQVLTWNPAAETLTGRTRAQVQGQSLWQVCSELAHYREMFERVVNEGQVAHLHKKKLDTDAGTVYHDVSIFPLIVNDARIEGAVLRIDDVTRRVQMEEMMLQSAKMASIGRLAAGVAHEINNPLGAMMQSAQILQMAFDTQRPRTRERLQKCGVDLEGLDRYLQERDLVEYLDGIRDVGGRAAKIVSDLLSFSRRGSADLAPHNLNTLVEKTLDLAATDYDLRKKYDFRDIKVVQELAPGLPQIACDGQQIQQVVLNLVRNAAQAMVEKMEKGEGEYQPRLTLRTALSPSLSSVRLEVENNGPSIPKAAQARLFEPFFTTKDVGEGTGLGLWLCWSIVVERHGGQIWIEPAQSVTSASESSQTEELEEDSGVRFVVELPIIQ
jgi:PAS domain S-box-containing protein